MERSVWRVGVVILAVIFLASGCTFIFQKGRRSDAERIEELSRQLEELANAKRLLEDRLSDEIGDGQVSMKMMDKGLVITVVGDLLFDSGKAEIRKEAFPVLKKIARVLEENMSEYPIGIEGHTDNQPIKQSGWKSNWELSSARALSVLHHMINNHGIAPDRISAIGFGEYNPVASNSSARGRQLNRRVEIVVMPHVTKVREGDEPLDEETGDMPVRPQKMK
jgi:chemotaxis protein MotB